MKKKLLLIFLSFFCLTLASYGGVRLYYALTDGFAIGNIKSAMLFDEAWQVRPPTKEEIAVMDRLAPQKFTYLGKGCQSYVFESEDGQYVLKFIKHQRFQTKPWVNLLSALPYIDAYKQERVEHKKEKLKKLLIGWQTAFNQLPKETGVVWVHLNEGASLPYHVKIVDKIGSEHAIALQDYQFMVQRKVEMLCPYMERLIAEGKTEEGKLLIDRILAMILGFYQRGFADNDHAIMQNTGIAEGYPVPFDVGQFTRDEQAADPQNYRQALFNKTYRFKFWLGERSPVLRIYLEERLRTLIGPGYDTLKPHFTV